MAGVADYVSWFLMVRLLAVMWLVAVRVAWLYCFFSWYRSTRWVYGPSFGERAEVLMRQGTLDRKVCNGGGQRCGEWWPFFRGPVFGWRVSMVRGMGVGVGLVM